MADLFDLPGDVVLDLPRVTILGNLQMLIENHRGLVEYSPGLIRVATATGQIVVTGEDLVVGSVFSEDLSVTGRFTGLGFEETPPSEAPPLEAPPSKGTGSGGRRP